MRNDGKGPRARICASALVLFCVRNGTHGRVTTGEGGTDIPTANATVGECRFIRPEWLTRWLWHPSPNPLQERAEFVAVARLHRLLAARLAVLLVHRRHVPERHGDRGAVVVQGRGARMLLQRRRPDH